MNWDQKRIADWGRETFGVPENALSVFSKLKEEFDELELEINGDGKWVSVDAVLREAADVVIMLYQLVDNLAGDLHEEIDKKMDTNVKRTWEITGDGFGHHI